MSIAARLTVAATLALALGLGLTAAALDRAFREAGLEAVRDRLEARVYALLAAAETAPDGRLRVPEPPDPQMATPAGGRLAQVRTAAGDVLWRSASAVGTELDFPDTPAAGASVFAPRRARDGTEFFALAFPVRWQIGADEDTVYRFEVAETRAAFDAQLHAFRRSLWGWFAAAAALVVLAQLAALRWGLAPVRRLAREIRDIEAGRIESLPDAERPAELAPVVASTNSLIATGRRLIERHRDALDDLAHSLKTPLAILRGEAGGEGPPAALRATLAEQLDRIDRSVEYHLRRAATGAAGVLSRPLAIAPVAARVRDAVARVHAARGVHVELDVPEACAFRADEGDLMEILGNLLDNACKWARSAVRVRIRATGAELTIDVEDDGPGIAPALREQVLARGARADESPGGQGIGLAVVRALAEEAYGGAIEIGGGEIGGGEIGGAVEIGGGEIGGSGLGGARVRVRLAGGGASVPRAPTTPDR